MDFALGEPGTRVVDDLARRLAGGVAARAPVADELGVVPLENWLDLAAADYPRIFHRTAIGGLGLDGVSQARAMEALAMACPNTYWSATMSALVCAKLIDTYGNPRDHRRLLDPLLACQRLACFPVVETTAGSDPGTYTTTVRRTADGYEISGEKSRITNAVHADLAVVLARLEGHHDGWCYAFVDLHQDSVQRYAIPSLGLRAMGWGGLVFERTRIDPRDVVPIRLEQFPEGMAWGWLFISIGAIALAQNAFDASVRHARVRTAFGRPLIEMERVKAALADMHAEIEAARLLAYRCAWHRAEGRLVQDLVAMLKPYATELAVRAAEHAVQIHGALGLTAGHPVERLYRDAPMHVIGGFASNRLREVAAQLIGLPVDHRDFDPLGRTGLDLDPPEEGD